MELQNSLLITEILDYVSDQLTYSTKILEKALVADWALYNFRDVKTSFTKKKQKLPYFFLQLSKIYLHFQIPPNFSSYNYTLPTLLTGF